MVNVVNMVMALAFALSASAVPVADGAAANAVQGAPLVPLKPLGETAAANKAYCGRLRCTIIRSQRICCDDCDCYGIA
ncbi:UNVERIFIED_CONTAM: hypothetical protein HDU68_010460 [Siphonaria sp. JEL0065]|nr:hypothetical protein HDU68_010460 [Siphonaria sp. JEL0065]